MTKTFYYQSADCLRNSRTWFPEECSEIDVEVGAYSEAEALEVAAEQICVKEYESRERGWRSSEKWSNAALFSVYVSFSQGVPGKLLHTRLILTPTATAQHATPKTPLRLPTAEELAEANA